MIHFFLVSFISSLIVGLLLLITKKYHLSISTDTNDGFQKVHETPTPRIGGISIIIGIIIGLISLSLVNELTTYNLLIFIITILPVFIGGLIEDLWKNVSPVKRLLLALLSALLASIFLNINISRTGFDFVDNLINISWHFEYINTSISFGALILTVLAISGLAHAINIIDGYNGLMLGYSIIVTLLIIFVSSTHGDTFSLNISLIFLGALSGLFVLNFPMGYIFTGDGGAYLIGFMTALLCISLSMNTDISPWLIMLWLIYPGAELLFSMIRKSLIEKTSPLKPDPYHLHLILIYIYKDIFKNLSNRQYHVIVTTTLLGMFLPIQLISLLFQTKTIILFGLFIMMSIVYLIVYIILRKKYHRITKRR